MLERNVSTSLYQQLADELSKKIFSGEFVPGTKLPSENTLCREYQVSRITVRQAMNLLTRQGLIESIHGKGSFVRQPAIQHSLHKIVSFRKVLQEQGLEGYTKLRSFVNEESSTYFDTPCSCLELVGYANHKPIVFYCSYFEEELGKQMLAAASRAEREKIAFSTYDLYKETDQRVVRIEQKLCAKNADGMLSEIMELNKGKALLVLQSFYYGENDILLEYKEAYYRSDVYSFRLLREV